MRCKTAVLLMFVIAGCLQSFSQSATATNQALFRTFMIQVGHERGTAFSIDVDHREYWITAKHIFTGAKTPPYGTYSQKTATAYLLSQVGAGDQGQIQHWIPETFTVIDPGKDIDILVLVSKDSLLTNLSEDFTLKTDEGGEMLGGECEFLGFPYGGGWKARWQQEWKWLPFIKRCGLSATISDGDITVWVLDGINNEGFSGGPVLYGTGSAQKVFAVISGYQQEVLDVLPAQTTDGKPTGSGVPPLPDAAAAPDKQKQIVKANSGFILAFDIQSAIKAIRANPIGPLRTSK